MAEREKDERSRKRAAEREQRDAMKAVEKEERERHKAAQAAEREAQRAAARRAARFPLDDRQVGFRVEDTMKQKWPMQFE